MGIRVKILLIPDKDIVAILRFFISTKSPLVSYLSLEVQFVAMAGHETAIPTGSWILVTGATGYIASHIIKQFLERGYKVRGTVRDLSKATWIQEELFIEESQRGDLSLVQVRDLGAEKAFDQAVKGISAIVHVATISSLDPDPHHVITKDVSGMKSLLNAAAMEPSVKRFVYTSSFVTAAMPIPDVEIYVGPDTFNDAAVTMAWAPPPYENSRGMLVYMASKTEAERAMWRFVSEEKPNFIVNTVSPLMTIGTLLHNNYLRAGGTPSWLDGLFHGDPSFVANIPASKSHQLLTHGQKLT